MWPSILGYLTWKDKQHEKYRASYNYLWYEEEEFHVEKLNFVSYCSIYDTCIKYGSILLGLMTSQYAIFRREQAVILYISDFRFILRVR